MRSPAFACAITSLALCGIASAQTKWDLPTAYAASPREILLPPRAWAERTYNIQRWTTMPAGGHFAALEQPEALAADIRAFFRPLR